MSYELQATFDLVKTGGKFAYQCRRGDGNALCTQDCVRSTIEKKPIAFAKKWMQLEIVALSEVIRKPNTI